MPSQILLSALSADTLRRAQGDLQRRIAEYPYSSILETQLQELDQIAEELERRARRRYVEFQACVARTLLLLLCIGSMIGMAARADLKDVEGNVAAYLQANPTVAHQLPAERPHKAPMLGFKTEGGRNMQVFMTGLMLLDTAQTVTIAGAPDCLREGNNLASLAFGSDQPSHTTVLLTNALYIAGHWALGTWLDHKAQRSERWSLARRAYQVLTIVGHGWAIKENHRLGIRPFSQYDCVAQGRQL
ncbi:MAG TPA: hypothetical protein VEC57_20800 [Candidatus Limnocylindrales bacterium]|nr:hypothetical protein [Candidatus Limnocylindrales bacterium]